MKHFILALALTLIPALGQAANEAPTKACLKKVVAAVNKHHTLAEGSVYALRVLYNGELASSLLVGHSDETDPTDYLVTVDKRKCSVKSIVYTNDASGVEEYTEAELIENVLK
jgi:hypothetical protein